MTPRPHSLAEVARRTAAGESFEFELSDFLHEFQLRGEVAMLLEEPVLLQESSPSRALEDAYLAAVAVSLASATRLPVPAWARNTRRVLREPWFASSGRHMRALLLVESPAAFRERNLFVTANALSVA
jgi:hypothetical protein